MCVLLWDIFDRVYDLVEKYPFVYGAVGVHPDDADKVDATVLDEIRRYCDMKKNGSRRRDRPGLLLA